MGSTAHRISNTTSLLFWLAYLAMIVNELGIFASAFFRFASEEHIVRLLKVHQDIESRGRYVLTYDELEYGVRLAWRNAPRCIARVQWSTLKVKC